MDSLLAVTLRSLMVRRHWNAYRSVLGEDSFSNANASAIYIILVELHAANKRNVTESALRLAIDGSTSPVRAEELGNAVTAIMKVTKDEIDTTSTAIRRFAARGFALKASKTVTLRVNDPTFDYSVPARLMARAAEVSQGNLRHRTGSLEAGLPGDEGMVRRTIPLGIHPELDRELMGGIGRGELLIFLAPPERGKTSMLWRCATNAVLAGENVVAYTLEIAEYKCWLRYYQCLTGMTNTEMIKGRQVVSMRRAQAADKGSLWINDFSGQDFTPEMLNADLEQMVGEGMNPTYVMIDYVEKMKPSGGFGYKGKTSSNLGGMVQEVRQVSVAHDVATTSAWQVNRAGAGKVIHGTTDVSESWEVIKEADILIGMNQTEAERNAMIMRLNLLKQREDISRNEHVIRCDLRRMKVGPLEGAASVKGKRKKAT